MDKKTELKTENEWQMSPKFLFGIRKTSNICMDFVSDDTIMYPCGIYMVYHKIPSNSKNYVALEKTEKIRSIFIFIEKELIVVEESNNESKTSINFLDIVTSTKIKSIQTNFNSSIIDMKFSNDGSRFIIQNEMELSCWLYEKARMVCWTSVVDHKIKPRHNVKEISFYPNNKQRVIVIGNYIFTSYSIIDDAFVIDWEILHTDDFMCHLWISSKEIILGNIAGQISVFNVENCNYDSTYFLPTDAYPEGFQIAEKQLSMYKVIKDHQISFQIDDSVKSEQRDYLFQKNLPIVNNFVQYSHGFICLVDKKRIYFYKKDDSCFIRSHLIDLESHLNFISKRTNELIERIILNKSETILICMTSWKRIYKLEFTNEMESVYQLGLTLVESFHFENVLSMDVSLCKPLVATCGKDNIFNIWNYETGKLEHTKYFDEELFCIAIHPIGLYAAVACFEKIKIFTIYVNDLKCTKIINVGKSIF